MAECCIEFFPDANDQYFLYYPGCHHSARGKPRVVIDPAAHAALHDAQRNLLYTAVTRGRRLVIVVGTQKALAIAVKKRESAQRITTLNELLVAAVGTTPSSC